MASVTVPPASASQYGAALSIIQKQYGWILREVESVPNVALTPTLIAPQNGDRVGLVIANLGSSNLIIDISSSVSINQGIQLNSSGGVVSFNLRDDMTLTAHEWWAIQATVAQNCFVLELIGVRPLPGG